MSKKLLLLALMVGVGAIVWFKCCGHCKPPKLPDFDLDYWWGPKELQAKQDKSIRPFKVEFSDAMVTDLKQRLNSHRPLVPPLEGIGFQYGFNTKYLQTVLDYWKDSYNFKEREKYLNKYKQFKTNVQGLDIHFIHVKPNVDKNVKVIPLLLLHGWPGSVREFYEMIPLLTTSKTGFDFVFEVIAPSLPGYGFSSAAVKPGLGAAEVAVVMRNLMHRIGHKQFFIQGGDWGSVICSILATVFPNEILGHHTNMLGDMSTKTTIKTFLGSFYPSWIVDEKYADRMYPLGEKFAFLVEESGYMHLQSTKPDTVGVALTDSPAGLAAYILEKFAVWTNPTYKSLPDGNLTKRFKLVDLLDNIMIYWSTNSITTSMRLYSETMNKRHHSLQFDDIPTPVPTWGFQSKYELMFTPESLMKRKYPNLLHATVEEEGGHFVAFEMPAALASDVFIAIRSFQEFHLKQKKTEL